MNSPPSTSHSTSYTLWDLSRRYLAILMRVLTTGRIINGVGLWNFRTKSETYACQCQCQSWIYIAHKHKASNAWRGGGAKMRNFYVRSIFEVQFLSENFSLYMVMVGLRNFSRYNACVRKPYDQPYLNLNNSTIWRATLIIFVRIPTSQHRFYEKPAWNPHHDAPFPGRVPVITLHSARSHNAWKNKVQTFWVHVWRAFSQKFVDRFSWNFQDL